MWCFDFKFSAFENPISCQISRNPRPYSLNLISGYPQIPKEGPSEDDETSAYKPPEAGLMVAYRGLGFIGLRGFQVLTVGISWLHGFV